MFYDCQFVVFNVFYWLIPIVLMYWFVFFNVFFDLLLPCIDDWDVVSESEKKVCIINLVIFIYGVF